MNRRRPQKTQRKRRKQTFVAYLPIYRDRGLLEENGYIPIPGTSRTIKVGLFQSEDKRARAYVDYIIKAKDITKNYDVDGIVIEFEPPGSGLFDAIFGFRPFKRVVTLYGRRAEPL